MPDQISLNIIGLKSNGIIIDLTYGYKEKIA